MQRFLLSIGFICVFAFYSAAAQDGKYQRCTQEVTAHPQSALKVAEEWIQTENHPSAFHCRALALFALKRYREAAGALEHLSGLIDDSNLVLWGNVVRQAARSWQLASEPANAIIVLSKGISKTAELGVEQPMIGKLSAELLHDRSQLYRQGGRALFAIQDLDQAISLAPDSPQLRLSRATALADQGAKELAQQDLQSLQQNHPNYPGAKELQQRLQ